MKSPLSLLLFLEWASGTEPIEECVCAHLSQEPAGFDTTQLVQAVGGVCPDGTYKISNSLVDVRLMLLFCRDDDLAERLHNCLCVKHTFDATPKITEGKVLYIDDTNFDECDGGNAINVVGDSTYVAVSNEYSLAYSMQEWCSSSDLCSESS